MRQPACSCPTRSTRNSSTSEMNIASSFVTRPPCRKPNHSTHSSSLSESVLDRCMTLFLPGIATPQCRPACQAARHGDVVCKSSFSPAPKTTHMCSARGRKAGKPSSLSSASISVVKSRSLSSLSGGMTREPRVRFEAVLIRRLPRDADLAGYAMRIPTCAFQDVADCNVVIPDFLMRCGSHDALASDWAPPPAKAAQSQSASVRV